MPYATYKNRKFRRKAPRYFAASVIQRRWRARRKRMTPAKVLKIAKKAVQRGKAIKHHYVQDTATTNISSPTIIALTGIGSGETPNTHEGDKINLRELCLHCDVSVTNSGGTPSVSHPTRWNMMVVRSVLDVGTVGVPAYSHLFDTTITPASMAIFDSFRQLNSESLSKVKILVNKKFTLAPQSYDATSGYNSPYPGYKHFEFRLKLKDDMIEYRTGTSTPVNVNYYLMIQASSSGAVGNLGLQHAFVSKLTFRDKE